MEIIETTADGVVTLALIGRLDGTSSLGFEARVFRQIEAGHHRMIIDMAQLDFINSVGLRVFMAAAKLLKPLDGRMVLCALQPSIQHLFDVAGLSTIFTIAATREEAATLVAS
jgi:anti-anti-sigma factor